LESAKPYKNANRDSTTSPARGETEETLSDQRRFILSAEQFDRFSAELDKPPAENERLRRLLQTPAPWEA